MTPFIDEVVEEGFYIDEKISTNFVIGQNSTGVLFSGFVTMGFNHLEIERQYGKYDDALAYVGGLFGLVIAFLAFFMMSFNEYRYELFVSEAFSYRDQSKVREDDFHFFMYLKYVMYDWVKTLCCCRLNWEDCRKIDIAREEVSDQIDVQLLLRRISRLEEIHKRSVSEEEDICTYLTEDQNIHEARSRREVIAYYDKVVGHQPPLTIRSIENIENVFSLSSEMSYYQPNGSHHNLFSMVPREKSTDRLEDAIRKADKIIEVDDD